MDKKAIKKILAFVKMLKAPVRMIPYIVSIVITVIRRHTEGDKAAVVSIEQQGFICRKRMDIAGGCGSPAVAVRPDGKAVVVYACSRIVDGALVYSLCLCRSNDLSKASFFERKFIFDSPMQLGNVTVTATPYGWLLSWRSKIPSKLHVPSKAPAEMITALRKNNSFLFLALSSEEKEGGTYYAFLPENCDGDLIRKKAPCNVNQGAVMLSDNEVLWMGESNGAAVAYVSTDKCNTFTKRGSVPPIPGGRTVSQVSCTKLKNGRLICVFSSMGELFISYSDDMGVRWSLPHMMNVKGTNPNLCIRGDGVLAMTYVQPNNRVSLRSMISLDGQYKWLEERALVISTADNCRRPYTAELAGRFYTVSRQRFAGEKESSVVFTLWSPHKDDEKLIAEAMEKKNGK